MKQLKVVDEKGVIKIVTEKAFEVIYKERGFRIVGGGDEKYRNVPTVKETAEFKEINSMYENLTVPELKEKAKNRGVVGYSSMTKGELVEILEGD